MVHGLITLSDTCDWRIEPPCVLRVFAIVTDVTKAHAVFAILAKAHSVFLKSCTRNYSEIPHILMEHIVPHLNLGQGPCRGQ